MKKGSFNWNKAAHDAFEKLKSKLSEAPMLALPNFDKLFEVDCDVSGVGIGVSLCKINIPVTPPTLRPGVLAFAFKSWDETDRVSPEN